MWSLAAAVGPVVGIVRPASAHEIIAGVSGLGSLAVHPFASVDTLMVLIGTALAVSDKARRRSGLASFALVPIGAAVGFGLQAKALLLPGLWGLPLVLALVLGALAAAGVRPARWVRLVSAFAAAATVSLGMPPERPGLAGGLEVVAATTLAIGVVLAAISLPRLLPGIPGLEIASRIVGAWIAAISALAIGASLR